VTTERLFTKSSQATNILHNGGHVLILGDSRAAHNWALSMGIEPAARRRIIPSTDPDRLRGLYGPIAVVDLGMKRLPPTTDAAVENARLANLHQRPRVQPVFRRDLSKPKPRRRWWAPQDYTWHELFKFWFSAMGVAFVLGVAAAVVIP
jgi:hypothetical protein